MRRSRGLESHAAQPSPVRLFVPVAVLVLEEADATQVIATLPQEQRGAKLAIVEAFSLGGFVRAWVGVMLREDRGCEPNLRGWGTPYLRKVEFGGSDPWAIRRSNAEQSNSSIRIGDGAILKVIRKIEDGLHPELEMSRFLSDQADFAVTPKLLGWIELHVTGLDCGTLSILQAFVPNQGDGWSWVLERLHRVAEPDADDALDQAVAWLWRLAVRTAEMHKALGDAGAEPAFRPEQVGAEDVQHWREHALAMAQRTFDGLAAIHDRLDAATKQAGDRLLAQRKLVADRVDALLPHASSFAKTRHHGDFHLGQVLVAEDGEPMRPLAERRAKHAVLRDVAGMLRSLSYAAATASRTLPESITATDRDAARDRLTLWELAASRACFTAYLEAMAGVASAPAERAESERVVRFFMLEKALYEIAYELANRPEWVEIPLRGVLRLIEDNRSANGSVHQMPFEAHVWADGAVRFRLWAPAHPAIRIEIDDSLELLPMQCLAGGWHEVITNRASPGSDIASYCPTIRAWGTLLPVTSQRTFTGQARWSTPPPSPGRISNGRAVPGKRPSSTKCTSAPLRRKGPSEPPSPSSTICSSLVSPRSKSCRSAISRVGGTGDMTVRSPMRRMPPMAGRRS
jgi:trehalose synthase-fused probable maltokinase